MNSKKCPLYGKCGGCQLLHLPYEKTIEFKKNYVLDCFKKEGINAKINKFISAKEPYNYRNKMIIGFKIQNSKVVSGFYEENSHKIIDLDYCIMHSELQNNIAKYIKQLIIDYKIKPYDEDRKTGVLRHVVIRIGIHTNEIMVILVTTDKKLGRQKDIVNDILSKYQNVKTIVQNINDKQTNAVLGVKNIKLYGNGYIFDKLGDFKFKISPLSFYQINPIQTEVLYNKAIEFANLTGNEIVYDLYCGIGTISLFVSKHAKQVYGIESVKDAIKDANENKRINKVNNVEFMAGRVENTLQSLSNKTSRPDVIFVDPPRSGLDKTAIQMLKNISAPKIVYISCNPETLARDIKLLSDKYETQTIQPVDMFPHTSHIECVTVLTKKNLRRFLDEI